MIRTPHCHPSRQSLSTRRAYHSELERFRLKLEDDLTPDELAIANAFYAAGMEDKADEIQSHLTDLEMNLAHKTAKPQN